MMLRIVSLLAAVAATGCYSPALVDCTVTCSGADECAGDQICTSAGMCAAEGITCASATPDAPTVTIALHVQVDGTGKVVLAGVGECVRDCTWQVPLAMLRLDAQRTESDTAFEKWTTMTCGGAAALMPTCTFTPTGATTVGAKFR